MRTKLPIRLLSSLIILSSLILFFGACKKDIAHEESNTGTNKTNVQEAKEFFNNSILKNSEGKITSSDSKPRNSDEIPEAIWEFAKMKGEGVRVPLKFKSKLNYKIAGTNKTYAFEDLTYLLLYKNKQGIFEVEKVTTMPDKDYVESASKQKKFSGFVFVEDWYGNFKKIFEYKGDKYRKINISTGPYATKKNSDQVTNGLGGDGCVYLSGGFACVGAGNGQTCTERPGRYVCSYGGGNPWDIRDGGINPAEEKPAPGFDGGDNYPTEITPSLDNFPNLDLSELSEFPEFKKILSNLPAFLKKYDNIVQAMRYYTNFSENQIKELMQPGKGPKVYVVDNLKSTDGRKLLGQYDRISGKLQIDGGYVRGLDIVKSPERYEIIGLLLTITTLHEFVHYGRDVNNLPYKFNGQEAGLIFEQNIAPAPGINEILPDNATDWLKVYQSN